MKKTNIVSLILVFAFSAALFASCGEKIVVGEFSYDEVEGFYSRSDAPGAIREGFVNTGTEKIKDAGDAVRLAEKEHPIQADEAYAVFYDPSRQVWMVSFEPEDD